MRRRQARPDLKRLSWAEAKTVQRTDSGARLRNLHWPRWQFRIIRIPEASQLPSKGNRPPVCRAKFHCDLRVGKIAVLLLLFRCWNLRLPSIARSKESDKAPGSTGSPMCGWSPGSLSLPRWPFRNTRSQVKGQRTLLRTEESICCGCESRAPALRSVELHEDP